LLKKKYIVGVLSFIPNDCNQIFLVKHSYLKNNPWGFPGGTVKNEKFIDAIKREVREECRVDIEVVSLLGMYQYAYRTIGLLFICDFITKKIKPNYEISDWDFFDLDNLPPMTGHHKAIINNVIERRYC